MKTRYVQLLVQGDEASDETAFGLKLVHVLEDAELKPLSVAVHDVEDGEQIVFWGRGTDD